MDNFTDGHNWYACTHNRPTYCNVCREVLSGVMNHGLSCDGKLCFGVVSSCVKLKIQLHAD